MAYTEPIGVPVVQLNQYRVVWQQGIGAPGVSTFYSAGTPDFLLGHLKTFFEAIKGWLPGAVTIKYPGVGHEIESTTGQAVGGWSSAAPADTVGAGAGNMASAVGGVINWHTSVFVNGRELRGKTFLVPLVGGAFGPDGQLTTGAQTQLLSAALAVPGGPDGMQIFSRRSLTASSVTVATVPRLGAVLRTRRD